MSRPYQASLCGCDTCGTCLKAWFCTCFLIGQNHQRIKGNVSDDPGCCSGWCWGYCCLGYCSLCFILPMIDRGDMRRKYDLQGGSCGACLVSACCVPCEATQTKKELDYIQMSQTQGGYVQNGKMVAQPMR
ncbi:hypothetical protein G7Y89_g1554 [Cudoniella acicularis]|uniref:PLAC8-domain-containing protein n=1 Tax=Cudoniella acicularis TaxID=354080 RepID=A0A8H4W6W1_9HELO|nr:hypothetical protein G7Y89_g1554 [Cudoniella acicularis]